MPTNLLEQIRISIPDGEMKYQGRAEEFFDILPNSQGLTEEYLYAHQPTTNQTIPVYSTSEVAIGKLDDCAETRREFNIIDGPVIIVARKGYAGRLYVIENPKLIVHEDAYPIKPKQQYESEINLWWFAQHYSVEFQANRTSPWGIGDFPRTRFNSMRVLIPQREYQDSVVDLYLRRRQLLSELSHFQERTVQSINEMLELLARSE
jgi:hypothetical protein